MIFSVFHLIIDVIFFFLFQGESESIRKVKLEKPCCWTTIFKKDGKASGLILVYQTGLIEIR